LMNRPAGAAPVIMAARNVHRAFVYAAALLDFDVVWLWPTESRSLCACAVTAEQLETTLAGLSAPPASVYITAPDYLGGMADVATLAEVCHRHGTVLAVDNAHGAYLRFLEPSRHPLDLGADLCCDSAHKTLPVLTGGAYLHISKAAPAAFREQAKTAMALFGSTSPSYLTMASLDLCNRYLAGEYRERLAETVRRLEVLRGRLRTAGWQVEEPDTQRLTLRVSGGTALAEQLRCHGIECEFADPEHLVLMLTPENDPAELERLCGALGENRIPVKEIALPLARGERVLSIREAMFAPHQTVPAAEALGQICGAPTVGCPPAIPIAVTGERIGPGALALFRHYGVETVDILA
ncbi:MAG: amino acid decarboxylase, partial [Oscillibacter sp.]|nr:amino acid decarboxylase [Oscillibacter sp.]